MTNIIKVNSKIVNFSKKLFYKTAFSTYLIKKICVKLVISFNVLRHQCKILIEVKHFQQR